MADSTIKVYGSGANYRPVFQIPGRYSVKYSISLAGACTYKSPLISYINISGATADFTRSKATGCLPFTSTITSNILQNIHYGNASDSVQYEWLSNPTSNIQFSDIHSPSPNVVITASDNYSIALKITNSTGCITTISKSGFFKVGVAAAFNNPNNVCLGNPLTASSYSFNAAKYEWMSVPSSSITPSSDSSSADFLFPAAGKYKLRLVVTSPAGCNDTAYHIVNVEKITADFFSNDTLNTCAPSYVSFYVHANGADSFFWSFGDGETLTTTDTVIAHIYKINSGGHSSGFDVTLIAKNDLGCSDTLTRKKYITVLGPVPAFSMSNTKGCEALPVSFVNKSQFAPHLFLDYGDFSQIDTVNFGSHSYIVNDSSAGYNVYKPRLLAKDMFGCSAWAPVTDSVIVYRHPIAHFNYSANEGCWPYPVQFTDSSLFATRYFWDFDNDGKIDDTTRNPLVVLKPGTYNVKLIVENGFGCRDSVYITKSIIIYPNVSASLVPSSDTICSGVLATLNCIVDQPQLITKYRWTVDGVQQDSSQVNGPKLSYLFIAPGSHSVNVVLTTVAGCIVNVSLANSILVPDTTQQQSSNINYVTVANNSSIHINWQPSSATFFAKYDLYRVDNYGTNLIYTTFKKTDTSYTDLANIDVSQHNYTYFIQETNFCGKLSMPSIPHTDILLNVSPTGLNKLQLTWNSYKGWTSVSSYNIYKQGAGPLRIIASLNAQDTSYIDDDICDSTYTYYIKAIDNTGQWASMSNTVIAKPNYIVRIQGENMVYATVTNDDKISLAWTATAPRTVDYLIDRYNPATGWVSFVTTTDKNNWTDESGSVNESSYSYRVHILDKCGNISGPGTIGTTILLKTEIKNDAVALKWNKYAYWQEGVDHYIIEILQNDGIWNTVGQTNTNDTTYLDTDPHPDIYGPFIYRVTAIQAGNTGISSSSNKSSAILASRIFIPNAFTPTGDKLNDVFKPMSMYLCVKGLGEDYFFTIYDRWGHKMFETTDPNQGWDGTWEGQPALEGVYIYFMKAIGFDRHNYFLKGNVTLLR